jgi:hypothetical protein
MGTAWFCSLGLFTPGPFAEPSCAEGTDGTSLTGNWSLPSRISVAIAPGILARPALIRPRGRGASIGTSTLAPKDICFLISVGPTVTRRASLPTRMFEALHFAFTSDSSIFCFLKCIPSHVTPLLRLVACCSIPESPAFGLVLAWRRESRCMQRLHT